MKIVGLAGKARSGKDTIADIIKECDKSGDGCYLYSLAVPLKNAASAMFGVELSHF